MQVTITARVIWYSLKEHKAALGMLKSMRGWPSKPNWSIFSFLITTTEFFTICQVFTFKCILSGFGKATMVHENWKCTQDLSFLLFYFLEEPGNKIRQKEHIKTSVEQNASHGKWGTLNYINVVSLYLLIQPVWFFLFVFPLKNMCWFMPLWIEPELG